MPAITPGMIPQDELDILNGKVKTPFEPLQPEISQSTVPAQPQISLPDTIKQKVIGNITTDTGRLPTPTADEMNARIGQAANKVSPPGISVNQPIHDVPVNPTNQTQATKLSAPPSSRAVGLGVAGETTQQRTMRPEDKKVVSYTTDQVKEAEQNLAMAQDREMVFEAAKAKEQQRSYEAKQALDTVQQSRIEQDAKDKQDYLVRRDGEQQDLVDKYQKMAIQEKGFWALASTDKKIASTMNLISAAAYTFARQPDRADKVLSDAYSMMTDTINKDLASQKQTIEKAREVINMHAQRTGEVAKIKDSAAALINLKGVGALTAIQNKLNTEIARINAIGGSTVALEKQAAANAANIAQKKQEIAQQTAKDYSTETTIAKKPTEQEQSFYNEMRNDPSKLAEHQKQIQAQITPLRDDPEVTRLQETLQAKQELENILANPGMLKAGSITKADFIARVMKQASYNPQLANQMMGSSWSDRAEEAWNSLSGKSGQVSSATLESIKTFYANVIQQQKPETLQKAQNLSRLYEYQNGLTEIQIDAAKASGIVSSKKSGGASSFKPL